MWTDTTTVPRKFLPDGSASSFFPKNTFPQTIGSKNKTFRSEKRIQPNTSVLFVQNYWIELTSSNRVAGKKTAAILLQRPSSNFLTKVIAFTSAYLYHANTPDPITPILAPILDATFLVLLSCQITGMPAFRIKILKGLPFSCARAATWIREIKNQTSFQ
ncbi:hypothetical protein RIR_jg18075.t1 [Rhizophagus irregularis DAOM 181602=DAOM 197198]|nr:hypothetical protein RIR_jg18075.t1 [Rhizophagus irregularis DAOM 181602=DAOM 197198]